MLLGFLLRDLEAVGAEHWLMEVQYKESSGCQECNAMGIGNYGTLCPSTDIRLGTLPPQVKFLPCLTSLLSPVGPYHRQQ